MNLTKFGIAFLSLAIAAGANAQGFAFGVDTGNHIYRVDLSNASSTLIGTANANGAVYESLGMTPGGSLYGMTSGGDLFSISTSNAFATFIGNAGLGNVEGMDWDATNGRMLISDFGMTPSVYSINLANATPQFVMTATSGGSVVRTLATRSAGTTLDIRRDVTGQGDMHGTLDYASGAYVTLGTVTTQILGIDYGLNGALYGLTASGDLVSINTVNGNLQTIGNAVPNTFFLGMATDVVPEPASMAVLGLGLAAMARRRSRRA